MRTFIFVKTTKSGDRRKDVVVGMVQSDYFPSSKTRDSESEFYGCRCYEVTENCHVAIN